ncbi:hypothetical protein X777_01294 [Ooceraea biroi]|uniref:Uncharacterized protein n=1 Tax=Ooceraea biroi TaxID=2015173 RepID=A0A026WQL4_OOCBI|nr:hypothetical protein X777_01294 [Ooceraea biroi]
MTTLWIVMVMLAVATTVTGAGLKCDNVRTYFEMQGFPPSDIPKEAISSSANDERGRVFPLATSLARFVYGKCVLIYGPNETCEEVLTTRSTRAFYVLVRPPCDAQWKISIFAKTRLAAREIRDSAIYAAIKHAQPREKTQLELKISDILRIASTALQKLALQC